MEKLSKYLKVAEAAQLLGVSENTVRSWADRGKLAVTRSPTGYRLFREQDLQAFLKEIAGPFNRRSKAK